MHQNIKSHRRFYQHKSSGNLPELVLDLRDVIFPVLSDLNIFTLSLVDRRNKTEILRHNVDCLFQVC